MGWHYKRTTTTTGRPPVPRYVIRSNFEEGPLTFFLKVPVTPNTPYFEFKIEQSSNLMLGVCSGTVPATSTYAGQHANGYFWFFQLLYIRQPIIIILTLIPIKDGRYMVQMATSIMREATRCKIWHSQMEVCDFHCATTGGCWIHSCLICCRRRWYLCWSGEWTAHLLEEWRQGIYHF